MSAGDSVTDNSAWVVLVYDRGYLQPRKDRLGPLETARTFDIQMDALKAATGYLLRKGKDGITAEAIRRNLGS